MSDRTYGAEEKAKLERLVQEGVTVMQEIEDLQGGLKDTVKAVAEELDIKPALINKAIKIALKRDWDKVADAYDDLETLVATVGVDKQMKTVYWGAFPAEENGVGVSELRYAEPVSILKGLKPKEFFGPNASMCPAIIDEGKNTFKINSPIDIDVTFNEGFDAINSKYPFEDRFLQHYIGPFGPDKVIQLSQPTYLFFSEEPLLMTQLPPYYEQNTFTEHCMGLSATFDISSWFRVVKPAFKLREGSRRIAMNTNDAIMYLKFNTDEKVKLVRFDTGVFTKEHKDVLDHMVSFKFHKKNPLVPTRLVEGYQAFKRARYHKKISKIIKENIL